MSVAEITAWITTISVVLVAVGTLAQKTIQFAGTILTALKELKKDLAENTEETKNGHAAKQKLAEEIAHLRGQVMKAEIKAARADSLETAMKLSPEGRAFLAVLEKNYGWRVAETGHDPLESK